MIFVIQAMTSHTPFWPRRSNNYLLGGLFTDVIFSVEKHLTFQSTTETFFFLSFSSSKVLNEGHYDILNTCDDRRLVVKAVTVDHLYNEPIIIPVLINDK